jgi:hypothetical protein
LRISEVFSRGAVYRIRAAVNHKLKLVKNLDSNRVPDLDPATLGVSVAGERWRA